MYKWKVDESLTNQVAEMLPYNNAFDVWKTDPPLEEILIQKIQSYQETQILNEILSQATSIISFNGNIVCYQVLVFNMQIISLKLFADTCGLKLKF